MICTVNQAIERAKYYLGYYEKASALNADSNDKSVFALNKGSNNYTYFGKFCGLQGQPWCAMLISTFIAEACDSKTDAKKIMHGVWPYTACDQLYNAAPSSHKGVRGTWLPKVGDVVVFDYPGNSTSNDHTGIVTAVSSGCTPTSGTITVLEGNTGDMCKEKTYSVTDSNIYRYVRLLFADNVSGNSTSANASSTSNQNGSSSTTSKKYSCTVTSQIIQETSAYDSGYCKSVQALLNAKLPNCKLDVDGEFGPLTKSAIERFQKLVGLEVDGSAGTDTQSALMKY